jgi:hypothetical protein
MICDPRLVTRQYGRISVKSLPPMPVKHGLAEVEESFGERMRTQ